MTSYVESMRNYFQNNSRIKEYPAHSSKVHSINWSSDGRRCGENSTKINTHCIKNSPVARCDKGSILNKLAPDTKSLELENSKRGSVFSCGDDDDIEDFQPPKKYRHSVDRCNVTIQNNCAENVAFDQSIHLSRAVSETLKAELINSSDTSSSSGTVSDTLKIDSSGTSSSTGTVFDTLKEGSSGTCSSTSIKKEISKEMGETTIPTDLPRIYFGTRTHKQMKIWF
ncbi:hypothetical protein TNIN_380921 [Trichonephila inaurata madagascariensis]|uniref:Uncharacterized protein n=1 Tax=Trichonephila inaurata madagascariensis TaxID=2747483 RepID=A0A8X6WNI1_9ARAC|nr:hypothetical protein TNIN_380921 [Trichonephila inaurata madagascariensis]